MPYVEYVQHDHCCVCLFGMCDFVSGAEFYWPFENFMDSLIYVEALLSLSLLYPPILSLIVTVPMSMV